MTLEKLVVSLPLAKRLQELGVKQESLYWWSEHTDPPTLWSTSAANEAGIWDSNGHKQYAAFTLGEVVEVIALASNEALQKMDVAKEDNFGIKGEGKEFLHNCFNPDNLAKMLIYLLEEKLLTL